MAIKKANFTLKEVAWVDEKPIKFQGFLEYPLSEKRTIRLVGEPYSTKEGAVNGLINEYMLWQEAMASFSNEITELK